MQSFVLVSGTIRRLGARLLPVPAQHLRGRFNASAPANAGLLPKLTAYPVLNRLTGETALNRSR
jgi:hypothetical protein